MLPPLNAAVPSTSASAVPVTRDEMIEYLRSGCKPRSAWKLGTEHEKLGFYLKDHRRIDYDTINKIFTGLQVRSLPPEALAFSQLVSIVLVFVCMCVLSTSIPLLNIVLLH